MLYNFVHEIDGDELRIHSQQGDAGHFSKMTILFSHMNVSCPLTVGLNMSCIH
jgi:hypothetical protein